MATNENWQGQPKSCPMWRADFVFMDITKVQCVNHNSRFVDIRVSGCGGTTAYDRRARETKDIFYSHSFDGAVAWLSLRISTSMAECAKRLDTLHDDKLKLDGIVLRMQQAASNPEEL